MDILLHDLRYAIRTLRKSPSFTLVAVLTLTLGIGATMAVFSIINGVLLHPLPFAEQERLFFLLERSETGGTRLPSYPNFLDWQHQAATIDLAYTRGRREPMQGRDGVENVLVAYVSPRFLSVLGARPVLGRAFLAEEEQPGHATAAVLTHHFWMQRFGGDSSAVGRTITLGSRSYTIIGVMPREAGYPAWADLWIPIAAIAGTDRALAERDFHADGALIGRLHANVSLTRATAELAGIARRLATAYPKANAKWTLIDAQPISSLILGDVRPRLLMLQGVVVLVLLIACANVAGLSLARAAMRTREIAIRSALGAGRFRVVRQLLTESALVALAGGALGLLGGMAGVRLLRRTAPYVLPRMADVSLDGHVVAFALGVSLLTALLVGLVPALRAAAPDLVNALKEGSFGAGRGYGHQRMRGALVTAEIALALVLVVGAGLLIQSVWRLERVKPGFNPVHLVTFDVTPPSPRYDGAEQAAALYARLADAVRAVPGVAQVALSNFPPGGGGVPSRVEVNGKTPYGEWGNRGAIFRTISRGYFRTADIPFRLGREFTQAELSSAVAVAIVNAAFARLYWRDESPLGQHVTVFKSAQGRADFGQPIHATVVGVANDVQNDGAGEPPRPVIFVPYTANPWTHMALIVRTVGDPAQMIPALRRALLGVEPAIPMAGGNAGFRIMEDDFASGLSTQRFNTSLLSVFALSALLLAAIGIYGLMAYAVAQRTREIGIRMALGARPRDVLRLVLRQALLLAGLGILLGLGGSVAATRLLASQLYGVTPTDPWTLASVAVILGGVALLACWLPARRATRVDPTVALRSE
ncbi:MAG TPA: ABC transporter permease [Gemmatimonadaceae bacterium]|nr:ABC transporter permease [Gemmatimonadaceae bacterium]